MKYSNTAIKELNARYTAVLRKCFLMNATVLTLGIILNVAPAVAADVTINADKAYLNLQNLNEKNQNAAGLTISYGDTFVNSGISDVKFEKNTSVNSGAAMKALNGFSAGDNWVFKDNSSDKTSGGLYVKIPNDGEENRTVSFGKNTQFIGNSSKWLGGALGIEAAETVSLGDGALFQGNSSPKDGGAVAVWTDSTNESVLTGTTLNLGKTEFTGNTAANRGGALANLNNDKVATAYFNTVNIGAGSLFTGNKAKDGGAVYNDGIMTISGTTFKANEASGLGGAIYSANKSKLYVENSVFDNNNAVAEGALVAGTNTLETKIDNTVFSNNFAGDIGAVALFGKAGVISNSTFTGNRATYTLAERGDGAGALFVGSVSQSQVLNTTFSDNESGTVGGAVATRASLYWDNKLNDQKEAKLDIVSSTFTGNKAATNGGAVYNTFYNGDKNAGYVTIADSTFTNNTAGQAGGAVYNDPNADKSGNYAKLMITDSVFSNNTAQTGGAVYNGANATLSLNGSNVFSGNKDADGLNDIYNAGTLNIAGNLTLDGGIDGTGNINFASDAVLTATLDTTTLDTTVIRAKDVVTNGAALNLILDGAVAEKTYEFITADSVDQAFKIQENNLYNITMTDDHQSIVVGKKNTDDIAASVGASTAQTSVIAGIMAGTSGNESFDTLASQIHTALQSTDDAVVRAAVKAAGALAPTEAPVSQAMTTAAVTQVLGAVATRFSGSVAPAGEASGDISLEDGAVWAKGLFNRSKLGGESGFRSYSRGLALGVETYATPDMKVGVGYAYTNADIKPNDRKSESDSHSAMLYGEYKPADWYVNAVVAYTWGRYDDRRYVLDSVVSAKHDVDALSLQAMTGYDMNALTTKDGRTLTVTPEVGLRYVNVHEKSYHDSLGNKTGRNRSDTVTGVAGVKTTFDWKVSETTTLKPEAKVALTYDVKRDNAGSVMTLANGSVVSVEGDALKRFGTELSLGVSAQVDESLELGLTWEGKFRRDYTDNTGMVTLKYHF